MATIEDIALVREFIAEPDADGPWTDARIEGFVDLTANVYYAAAEVWGVKAANAAALVNVAESGSSRSLGDLLKQAQAMEAYYRKRGDAEADTGGATVDGPVIARIRRGK